MLVNELSAGEEILNQLINLSGIKSTLSSGNVKQKIVEFTKVCAKARSAWALAVFSPAGKESLERYFTYHLQLINGVSEKVSALPHCIISECACKQPEPLKEVLEKQVNSLTDHLFSYFGAYPDRNIYASASYSRYVLQYLKADSDLVTCAVTQSTLPANLKSPVLIYLNHIADDYTSVSLTFSQLFYFRDFLREIKEFLPKLSTKDAAQQFADKLLELDFNHLQVFIYYQDKITSLLTRDADIAKVKLMQKYQQRFHFNASEKKERYDAHWPSLSLMLSDWLTNEIKVLEEKENAIQNSVIIPAYKLKLDMSVAHLACLLRLFNKDNRFGTLPLTEIFKFISDKFSTKRTETISAGGLSKAYYSISQVTAAEIKAILLSMVNHINRDYFPVMVAISVIIGAC